MKVTKERFGGLLGPILNLERMEFLPLVATTNKSLSGVNLKFKGLQDSKEDSGKERQIYFRETQLKTSSSLQNTRDLSLQ